MHRIVGGLVAQHHHELGQDAATRLTQLVQQRADQVALPHIKRIELDGGHLATHQLLQCGAGSFIAVQ